MRKFPLKLITLIILLTFNSAVCKLDSMNIPEEPKALTMTKLMIKKRKKRRREDGRTNHHRR